MEGSAQQPAVHGLSASAILAVAEGLRWADPQLSVALAEHVARSAGDDADARSAAERSAVLALGQSDRAAALILRAVPLLQAAEREVRTTDAAVLRCEMALAAVRCDDVDGAEALLQPLAAGQVLTATVRADALVAWAAARAARGDVPGVDAAARQVEDLVGRPTGDVRRLAVQRSRAHARRVAGDATDALAVLRNAAIGEASADGGRETAMLVADQVELLAGLGHADEAQEAGAAPLAASPEATTALAVGRVRCALARHVLLPAGDLDTAARLAREAEADLVARGHEAQAAEAIEVLAEVAARRGESRQALDELRRAHAHATAAREEITEARIALGVALARVAEAPAATADVGGAPAGPTEARPAADPDPLAAVRASLAALDGPDGSVVTGSSPADLLSAALAATEVGSFEDLTARPGTESAVGARDALTGSPGHEEAPEPEPRRRRGRYRDDEDPGAALAVALAAARAGGLEAFATTPAPAPNGDEPPDGSRVDAQADVRGGTREQSQQDSVDIGRADDAAEARSRRLARARARWETSDSLLPRRAETSTGHGDGAADGGIGDRPADDEPRRPEHTERREPDGDGDRHRHRRAPLEGLAGEGAAGSGRASTTGSGAQADGDRYGLLSGGLLDDPGLRRNGHGAVGGGRIMRGTAGPGESGREDSPTHSGAHPAAARNGHDAAPAGPDLRSEAREDEPVTAAGRWGDALGIVHGAGTPTTDADDEYRRELALTLVDLLSEYQDATPPAALTTQVPARPPATSTEARPATPPPARGTRNGVSSEARRADDSGPRLADLLADAMDAYHSVDPAADPAAGDRRTRR